MRVGKGGLVSACIVIVCSVAGCCGSGARTMPCPDPAAGDGGSVRVDSPALDCPSKLCLVTPHDGGTTALCTRECASDHDCSALAVCLCREP